MTPETASSVLRKSGWKSLRRSTGKGGRYRYYRCSRNLRRSETVCAGTSIRDEKLESVVIDAIAEQILLVERQLSMNDQRITPTAIERLGEVILRKLKSDDPVLRQGYARRFIGKVVVAPDTITISGPSSRSRWH